MTGVHPPFLRRYMYQVMLLGGMVLLAVLFTKDLSSSLAGAASMPVQAEANQRMVPLTSTGAHMDGFAVWSADGKQIAFMRDGQIWTAMPEPRRITGRSGIWDAVPRWLPGGDGLVFIRMDVEQGTARVMHKSLATGVERELAREKEQIGYIAVSPDGRDIVYTTRKRMMKLEQMTRLRTLLAVGGQIDMLPGGIAYAPDGKTLVFGFGERGNLNLYRIAASGGDLRRLTSEGGIMPAFARDGSQLAYRQPTGQSGIWVVDLSTGRSRRVAADVRGALYFHPDFAPTGQGLLLSRLNVRREGRPTSDIVSLHLQEGGDR